MVRHMTIKSFKGVVITSAIISVVCALGGMLISIIFSTPVGSTIVMMDIAVFAIFHVIGMIKGR